MTTLRIETGEILAAMLWGPRRAPWPSTSGPSSLWAPDLGTETACMHTDRNGLEVMTKEECVRLLSRATLGRISITAGALPVILPVNFLVAGDRIFIRTGRGTKLDAATRNAVVAFEVDEIDPLNHSGWSVLVTGIARAADPATSGLDHLPARWVPENDDERLISISMDVISGRRITIDALAGAAR